MLIHHGCLLLSFGLVWFGLLLDWVHVAQAGFELTDVARYGITGMSHHAYFLQCGLLDPDFVHGRQALFHVSYSLSPMICVPQYLFYVYECWACMYIHISCMCLLPKEVRESIRLR